MVWTDRVIIVAAQDVALARQLTAGIAGPSGYNMFTVGLAPAANLPATHYISNGLIQDNFASLLGNAQATYDAAGGTIPLVAIQGMYTRATVVPDGNPFEEMRKLGLVFVQPLN